MWRLDYLKYKVIAVYYELGTVDMKMKGFDTEEELKGFMCNKNINVVHIFNKKGGCVHIE